MSSSDDRSYYERFNPSVAAAVIFAVLYTITCATTTFQYFWYRCWFWLFLVVASWMQAIGYFARVISVKNTHERAPYIVQFLLVFLAPALMAASCYMAMGRVVLHVTPKSHCNAKSLWIAPRFMTPVFVTCDVFAFLIQVFGGTLGVSNDIKTEKRGYTIMKIGLVVQLLAFGFFIVISFRFHTFSKRFRSSWPDAKWIPFLWAINIGCLMIFVSTCLHVVEEIETNSDTDSFLYRFIEFAQGVMGYLSAHEWNFYVFEAAIILPVFLIYNVFHPAKYLTNIGWKQNRKDKEGDLRRDGAELM